MTRRLRIAAPPSIAGVLGFDGWARQATDALNTFPSFSISSTSNGPNSQITGDSGTILLDVGSSNTTFWGKLSGSTTTGWQPFIFSPIAYGDLPVGSGTWQTGSGTTITIARDLWITSKLSLGSLTGNLRADAGLVSVAAGVGVKTLFDHFADANNGTTVETDLYSDSLAAGQLANNGEKVVAQYAGQFVGDATSSQRVRAYFGGTIIFDSGALGIGITTSFWDLFCTVIRESSSVVRCSATLNTSFAALSAYAQYTRITGLTLANAQVLKITGTAAGATGASNQITAKEGHVQWIPAAA